MSKPCGDFQHTLIFRGELPFLESVLLGEVNTGQWHCCSGFSLTLVLLNISSSMFLENQSKLVSDFSRISKVVNQLSQHTQTLGTGSLSSLLFLLFNSTTKKWGFTWQKCHSRIQILDRTINVPPSVLLYRLSTVTSNVQFETECISSIPFASAYAFSHDPYELTWDELFLETRGNFKLIENYMRLIKETSPLPCLLVSAQVLPDYTSLVLQLRQNSAQLNAS